MGKKRTKQRTEAKVAVLREHFLILTGDVTEAIILNQLLYWTDIINKNDEQLIDEIEELEAQGKIEVAKEKENSIRDGWFFKSAKMLSAEIMMAAPSTVGKKLQSLEQKGLIQAKRTDDPNEAKYYRVNLTALRTKLLEIGFTLKGEIIDLAKVEQAEVKGQRKVAKGSRKKKKEERQKEANKGSNPPPIEEGHVPSSNRGTPPPIEDTPPPMEDTPPLIEDKKNTIGDHHSKDHSHKTTDHHQEGGDDDDAGAANPQPWETNEQYKEFNNAYVAVGADPIFDHETHYPKFLDAVSKVGFDDLYLATMKYITEEGAKAQIVYFLSGVYNSYLPKKKTSRQDKPSRLPKMLQLQQDGDQEPVKSEESNDGIDKIKAKLKQMNEKFAEVGK